MDRYLEIDEFNSDCLQIVDEVEKTGGRVIVMKGNKSVAQLSLAMESGPKFSG